MNPNRRHFLEKVAMAIGASQLGMLNTTAAKSASPELAAIGRAPAWLNSPRLTPDALANKVVVVQFCTYTCITWLRTLPYVRAWERKYRQQLVVIGVHTPEFAFEQNVDNVRRALSQMRIDYPVVIDNDYAIWRAFDNHYWPALYIIDPRGGIRHTHFGEGEYEQSERSIQRLLTNAGAAVSDRDLVRVDPTGVEAPADWTNLRSPENYVGYRRTANFASPGGPQFDRGHRYRAPARLALNQWALAGEWTMGSHVILSNTTGARIVCRFHARDLHLVMGPSRLGAAARFRVSIDGRPPGPAHGGDGDEGGNGMVSASLEEQHLGEHGLVNAHAMRA